MKILLGKNGQVVALKCDTVSQCWLELWCSCLCKHYETIRDGTFIFRNPKTALIQPFLVRPPSCLSGLPYSHWNTYSLLLGQSEKLQRQQSLSHVTWLWILWTLQWQHFLPLELKIWNALYNEIVLCLRSSFPLQELMRKSETYWWHEQKGYECTRCFY